MRNVVCVCVREYASEALLMHSKERQKDRERERGEETERVKGGSTGKIADAAKNYPLDYN